MALIFCPECGREISDKAVSCPGCGCPVEEMIQEDTRSELEKLVDEIYYKNKGNRTYSAQELMKRTGMDFKEAMDLMQKKHHSPEVKAEEKRKRAAHKEMQRQNLRELGEACQNLQNAFGGSKVARCPKCRSTSISYQDKVSVGRAAIGGALAGPAGAVLGGLTGKKGYAVCLNCGKRWKV